MVRKPSTCSKTLIAAFVATAFGASAGAALAQTTTSHDSRDVAAANSPTARHVTLTDQQSSQTLQYSRARNLRICNLTGRSPSLSSRVNAAESRAPMDRVNPTTRAASAPPAPVPLELSYRGMNEQLEPGNCYDFRASTVRLSPASTLPAGGELYVSILPVSANSGFVNGRTFTASTEDYRSTETWTHDRTARNGSDKESVRQLKQQLKQDDEQERQANAELSHARAKLAQTTRDLQQAESKERHVATAERRTEQAERHAQQNTDNARQNDGTPR